MAREVFAFFVLGEFIVFWHIFMVLKTTDLVNMAQKYGFHFQLYCSFSKHDKYFLVWAPKSLNLRFDLCDLHYLIHFYFLILFQHFQFKNTKKKAEWLLLNGYHFIILKKKLFQQYLILITIKSISSKHFSRLTLTFILG